MNYELDSADYEAARDATEQHLAELAMELDMGDGPLSWILGTEKTAEGRP